MFLHLYPSIKNKIIFGQKLQEKNLKKEEEEVMVPENLEATKTDYYGIIFMLSRQDDHFIKKYFCAVKEHFLLESFTVINFQFTRVI